MASSPTAFFNDLADKVKDMKHDDETANWSELRKYLSVIVKSPWWELSMAMFVVVSVIFVIIDTNAMASGEKPPAGMDAANLIVLFIYCVELSLRVYVTRGKFFRDMFSVFDLFVIVTDLVVTIIVEYLALDFPVPIVMFRIARILKITRAVRMMALFPELNLMLRGMVYAMKAIVWGIIMLGVVLVFWGILGVMFIHPLNKELAERGVWKDLGCDRCPRAFESVQQTCLTFTQQLVAGDSWGTVTMPIIEAYPEASLYFLAVLVSVSLALMNLILAVIVERANEARNMSEKAEAEKKEKEYNQASLRLVDLCQQLDADGSGCLSFDELKDGFQNNDEFASILKVMDIQENDLEVVFNMLDSDRSGDVGYKEFVEQLHMMRNHEAHTLLVFIKFYVMEIRQFLEGKKPLSSEASPAAKQPHGTSKSHQKEEPKSTLLADVSLAASAATKAVVWEDLEAELKKLEDIRTEMIEFSSAQVDRLETVQRHIVAGLREVPDVLDGASPATGASGAGGGGVSFVAMPVGNEDGMVCPQTSTKQRDGKLSESEGAFDDTQINMDFMRSV